MWDTLNNPCKLKYTLEYSIVCADHLRASCHISEKWAFFLAIRLISDDGSFEGASAPLGLKQSLIHEAQKKGHVCRTVEFPVA